MKTLLFLETSVSDYPLTQRDFPDERNCTLF